ncbi:hypothetical protein BDM02DRAFT_3112218 [Thelephora ganbajun]|uniref:Uncharacterized protein n=1 Tax=Thelephora ganbajun TaxID=370292 RepID=A0ACB6ZLH3_THEGA|nr:hypothetical protein BDM02DRAFT_3112218 [Thelephora ganbajun]
MSNERETNKFNFSNKDLHCQASSFKLLFYVLALICALPVAVYYTLQTLKLSRSNDPKSDTQLHVTVVKTQAHSYGLNNPQDR